ncbi:MAG: LysE family translocator [Actinobacteria bacterium]|nr:LysE family translocator [Actinomycetota bacterium]
MPELSALWSFTAASLALLVIPGPAVIFILNRSVADGRAIGLSAVGGLELGTLMHVLAATVGLSAVLAASEGAFNIVKYLGAIYLIFVGLRTLSRRPAAIDMASGSPDHAATSAHGGAITNVRAFRQGFIINTLNPKIALFFLSYLPQFIDPEKSSSALQSLVLGLIFVACGFLTDGIYALVASSLRDSLVKGKALPFIQRFVAGAVFVLLGVLAASAKVS